MGLSNHATAFTAAVLTLWLARANQLRDFKLLPGVREGSSIAPDGCRYASLLSQGLPYHITLYHNHRSQLDYGFQIYGIWQGRATQEMQAASNHLGVVQHIHGWLYAFSVSSSCDLPDHVTACVTEFDIASWQGKAIEGLYASFSPLVRVQHSSYWLCACNFGS